MQHDFGEGVHEDSHQRDEPEEEGDEEHYA